MEWEDAHRRFVESAVWGVLATSRSDGSPQQSMVGVVMDSSGRLVMSVKSYTAKWRNVVRDGRVSVVFVDGRQHLVVYGLAETIDADPLRAELTADVFEVLFGTRDDPQSLVPALDAQQRTVIRVNPSKVIFHP